MMDKDKPYLAGGGLIVYANPDTMGNHQEMINSIIEQLNFLCVRPGSIFTMPDAEQAVRLVKGSMLSIWDDSVIEGWNKEWQAKYPDQGIAGALDDAFGDGDGNADFSPGWHSGFNLPPRGHDTLVRDR